MDEQKDLEAYKQSQEDLNQEQIEDERYRGIITRQNNDRSYWRNAQDEHLDLRSIQFVNKAQVILDNLEDNRNGDLVPPFTLQDIIGKEKLLNSLQTTVQKIRREKTRRIDRQVQIDNNNDNEIFRVPYRGLVTRIEEIGNATNQIIKNNIAL